MTNDDLWAWTKNYFVPSVKGEQYYNTNTSTKTRKFLNDKSSFVVGSITFRQARIKSSTLQP